MGHGKPHTLTLAAVERLSSWKQAPGPSEVGRVCGLHSWQHPCSCPWCQLTVHRSGAVWSQYSNWPMDMCTHTVPKDLALGSGTISHQKGALSGPKSHSQTGLHSGPLPAPLGESFSTHVPIPLSLRPCLSLGVAVCQRVCLET